jgi:ubiquinone/menaquinone biosynthesis C-methylase UbiE
MAVEFPRCRVVGTDRTATFPKDIKPRNAKFIQVDSVSELPFSNKTFAFINVQTKLMLLSINNIYKFLGEMTRLCKVGGYIYFMIPDLEHDYADEIVNHYLHICMFIQP